MDNKSKKILSEISAGELFDKLSILEIKLRKIKKKSSQIQIKKEYKILKKIKKSTIKVNARIRKLFISIKIINLKLWNIEDKLRIYEKNKKFDKDFIKLARAVYFNNDKRAKIKLKINKILGSNIREIKQYTKY
tara:strand:- start:114 stop:515 length:402 start_codon:yes stop_codon:yes gene_type:complete